MEQELVDRIIEFIEQPETNIKDGTASNGYKEVTLSQFGNNAVIVQRHGRRRTVVLGDEQYNRLVDKFNSIAEQRKIAANEANIKYVLEELL